MLIVWYFFFINFFFLRWEIDLGISFTSFSFSKSSASDGWNEDSDGDYVGDERVSMNWLGVDMPMGQFEIDTD